MPLDYIDGDDNLSIQDEALNAAFTLVGSMHWGDTAPSGNYAGQSWADTSDARIPVKVRNDGNTAWKIIYYLGTDCGPVIDTGTYQLGLSWDTPAESYELHYPGGAPVPGQSYRVASIANGVAIMEWFTAAGGITSIDQINDVDTTSTSPSVNDVLSWDGSNWVPAAGGGGGGASSLNGLSDATITGTPAVGEILRYDGSNFVNVLGTDHFAANSHQHSASDINAGTLVVGRGGTGASSFTSGQLLVGNGTGAVSTIAQSTFSTPGHTHTESDITDLGNYTTVGHTHTESEITDLGNYALDGHGHALADLAQSSATTGQVAKWNGSAWAPAAESGGGASTLTELDNVTISGGADKHMLVKNGAGDYENRTISTADLTDGSDVITKAGDGSVTLTGDLDLGGNSLKNVSGAGSLSITFPGVTGTAGRVYGVGNKTITAIRGVAIGGTANVNAKIGTTKVRTTDLACTPAGTWVADTGTLNEADWDDGTVLSFEVVSITGDVDEVVIQVDCDIDA